VRLRGWRGNTVFGFEHPARKQGMPALVGSPRQVAEHNRIRGGPPLGFLRSVSASVLESGKSRRHATPEAPVLPLSHRARSTLR
jgi:hypothetical protein